MVENNILVVKTNDQGDDARYDIYQVHQELASMLKRCEIESYAIGSARSLVIS